MNYHLNYIITFFTNQAFYFTQKLVQRK